MQAILPPNVLSYDIQNGYEEVTGKNGMKIRVTWKGIAPWSRLYMFSIDDDIIFEYRTSSAYPTINTLEQASELLDNFSYHPKA